MKTVLSSKKVNASSSQNIGSEPVRPLKFAPLIKVANLPRFEEPVRPFWRGMWERLEFVTAVLISQLITQNTKVSWF